MRIAVAYENGEIFQHFGRTEQFKIYETEDETVTSTDVINTNGSGHAAVASTLSDENIDVVICGGLGDEAIEALTDLGIEVVSGVSGDADEAVAEYLAGNLFSQGVTCQKDEEGGCGCGGYCGCSDGDSEGCGCGGGCGGCGGGCGGRLLFEGPNAGKTMRVHYRGTFDDGTQFDSSYDRGEPLEFVCAAGMMISGFDKAVVDMEVGQVKEIHLTPDEAYGYADPNAIFTVDIKELPGSENLEVGQRVYLQNMYGQPFPVTVTAKEENSITFDANHEMAGKELNFKIEIVEIRD